MFKPAIPALHASSAELAKDFYCQSLGSELRFVQESES